MAGEIPPAADGGHLPLTREAESLRPPMAVTAPLPALRATSPIPGESVFNKGGLRADASIGPYMARCG